MSINYMQPYGDIFSPAEITEPFFQRYGNYPFCSNTYNNLTSEIKASLGLPYKSIEFKMPRPPYRIKYNKLGFVCQKCYPTEYSFLWSMPDNHFNFYFGDNTPDVIRNLILDCFICCRINNFQDSKNQIRWLAFHYVSNYYYRPSRGRNYWNTGMTYSQFDDLVKNTYTSIRTEKNWKSLIVARSSYNFQKTHRGKGYSFKAADGSVNLLAELSDDVVGIILCSSLREASKRLLLEKGIRMSYEAVRRARNMINEDVRKQMRKTNARHSTIDEMLKVSRSKSIDNSIKQVIKKHVLKCGDNYTLDTSIRKLAEEISNSVQKISPNTVGRRYKEIIDDLRAGNKGNAEQEESTRLSLPLFAEDQLDNVNEYVFHN